MFQYYFFAKSDLDLSIDFFLYSFSKVVMFYPIITTLDAGGGGRAEISKNVTNTGSQLTWEGGRAGISKNVTKGGHN